ncbi:Mitochondrial inner membrane protease ATP23 [Phytophthora pseudosyringae]|uniref:Mitochondrial inner membrane protease ATP23 n=1 Tax=Phytophthora pseudosyringae TaxID=221518 RepID=A0A8T1W414_9STRA|nr:Mitochondrial inner membrane protease ATP23 [Phytophthora pseudosyringae]
MATTQPADAAAPPAPPAVSADAPKAPASSPASPAPVAKKRRVERRERLRKSALCKHFDKPGGCPYPNCKFAHGRAEVNDSDTHSVAAQRKLIREQAVHRAEEQFQTADEGAVTSKRRGTMIERYYTEMFSCDTMGNSMEDQYVHMHSNRLCVVGVAESHPVMQEELVSVEFTPNVLESRVTGKKKKGGRFMLQKTVLCVLKCRSGREFTLYSCIRGSLIEVNERLQKEPELLKQKHQSDGYLVIIQPKKVEVAEIQESLLSKDEYRQFRAISKATASIEKPTETTPADAQADKKTVKEEPKLETVKDELMPDAVKEGAVTEEPVSVSAKEEPKSEAVPMEE